jgi:hypothetical protein
VTDTPNPPPDDALEPGDDFEGQKEQVDEWLESEKAEREEHERRQSES